VPKELSFWGGRAWSENPQLIIEFSKRVTKFRWYMNLDKVILVYNLGGRVIYNAAIKVKATF